MLHLENIYKIYPTGNTEALRGVNLYVRQGEYISIVGASGSGKTTLMNILGCLDTPSAGKYELDGVAVENLNARALAAVRNRKIGFIFQGFQLVPELTALENVELPLVLRGTDRALRRTLAKQALASVGLSGRIRHRPAELSGGQQQRVAIARAIAASPSVILADEPTGNLDPAATADILSLLEKLNKRGRTVVLITHDRQVAARAGRTITISNGQIQLES